MGDASGAAAGGGKSAGGGDISGGGGGGGVDPSGGLGGVDPSFGAATGGFDPSGIGGGGGGGGFGGQIPGDPTGSYGAMQNIGGQGQLGAPGQGAPTDQPGTNLQPWPQQASTAPASTQHPDVGYALMNGASSHPALLTATPGEPGTYSNPAPPGTSGPGTYVRTPWGSGIVPGTPAGTTPASPGTPGAEAPGSQVRTPWGTGITPGTPLPVGGSGDLSSIARLAGRGGALGGALGTIFSPTPANEGEPDIPQTGTTVTPVSGVAPASQTFTGDMTGSGELDQGAEGPLPASQTLTRPSDPSAGGEAAPLGGAPRPSVPTPQQRPPLDASGNIPAPQARPFPGQDLPVTTARSAPPDSSGAGGPLTDQGAQGNQGQGMAGGRGMQSPLEQLVGQFMHMVMGGRGGGGLQGFMGPLEQMLMHALGINPGQLFPQFHGGGFNPPPPAPGSGYFPAGTTGGRTVPPEGPQTPARPGPPPQAPPGPPGTPGNPPSALPPGRRLDDTSLPGGPYTATDPSQPPPWYPGGRAAAGAAPSRLQPNQIQVPRGAQQPSMRQTQPNVDRSSFRSQLAQNPRLVQKLAWMVNGEVGKNAPTHAKIVQLETVFNRAFQRGGNLDAALQVHSHANPRGYYAGSTYNRSAAPSSAELEQFKTQVLGPVMNGSNLSDVGYGPMTGNASGSVASHQFGRGQQGYKLQGGDIYFREGPFRQPFPVIQTGLQ